MTCGQADGTDVLREPEALSLLHLAPGKAKIPALSWPSLTDGYCWENGPLTAWSPWNAGDATSHFRAKGPCGKSPRLKPGASTDTSLGGGSPGTARDKHGPHGCSMGETAGGTTLEWGLLGYDARLPSNGHRPPSRSSWAPLPVCSPLPFWEWDTLPSAPKSLDNFPRG